MSKIVVLNAKGGSGKTTIATNLAAYYAARGVATALYDFDPQASSTYWLSLRDPERGQVHGVEAYRPPRAGATRAWQWRLPAEASRIIVDTPAGVPKEALGQFLNGASVVLVPVLPSAMDVHAAMRFLQDLLGAVRGRQSGVRVAVIGNRVMDRPAAFEGLERFLRGINVPLITALRESPCYGEATGQGLGIHELGLPSVQQDCEQWRALCDWLDDAPQRATAGGGFAAAGATDYAVAAPLSSAG